MSLLRLCSASPRRINRSAREAADAEPAVCDAVSSSKRLHRRIVLSSADLGVLFICHEEHNVRADWLLLIGFGMCLPIFVCTEHCGRLVNTLASYFGSFGFKHRNGPAPHVLTEVFRTLPQSLHAD